MNTDTICAIATPHGKGAIAVVRLSGPDAVGIADALFVPAKGGPLATRNARTLHYGTFAVDGQDIDEVVISLFRAPHSFTGEDVVEISCHGSTYVQQSILNALTTHGARMARPGEYTQRAFLNGKMDLVQAEAVADMIASECNAARRVALSQMKGGVSSALADLRDKLLHFTSLLELELDFSEEEVEFADRVQLSNLMSEIIRVVSRLASSFKVGNAIKNGVPVVIVGPTNAGKSTLLNALVGEDRAIVSDIHGTTRDALEEVIRVGDMSFRFVDTAGLRRTDDVIENLGIERTFAHIGKARIVVLLMPSESSFDAVEKMVKAVKERLSGSEQKLLVAASKSDLAKPVWVAGVEADGVVSLSARTGAGLDELRAMLLSLVGSETEMSGDVIITNARHYESLMTAHGALSRASAALDAGMSGEFVALDLHEALDALASITGQVTSSDVLNNIFKNFCVGK